MRFLNPTFIIAILIALSVHECAHAFVARKLGDPTAENAGRLTLNPLAHLDPIGTILFLVVGFGWAKPVPVNPAYFRHPKRDNALVAIAGPVSNLLLAFLAFLGLLFIAPTEFTSISALLHLQTTGSVIHIFLIQLFSGALFVNLALMAFNLLPIAPLDGSKVLAGFIPLRHELAYERFMHYGPFILLGLLLF